MNVRLVDERNGEKYPYPPKRLAETVSATDLLLY
jgi:hypothetical protein